MLNSLGRRTIDVMGTVFSLDLRDPIPVDTLDRAVDRLNQIDEMFSTYRPDSTICQLRNCDRHPPRCPPDVLEVLALCESAADLTDGYFTAFPYGELDPTGLVKGWAIKQVSDLLRDAGSQHHSVNGGGDIQLVGGTDDQTPWRIGITNPRDPRSLLAVVAATDTAVATSGTAERGAHIIDPLSQTDATHFLSVTITAQSILDADVIATAAFARGPSALDWVESLDDVDGLFVDHTGFLTTTSGFTRHLEGTLC